MLNKYQLKVANYLIQRGFRVMHVRPFTSDFLPYGTSLVNRMVVLDEIKSFEDFVEFMQTGVTPASKVMLSEFYCRDNPYGDNPYKDTTKCSKYVTIDDIESFEDFVIWHCGLSGDIKELILDHFTFTVMQNATH